MHFCGNYINEISIVVLILSNSWPALKFLSAVWDLILLVGYPTCAYLWGMLKIAYHPAYCHAVPEGHRFPMEKYELLPQQLLYEGSCTADNFFEPVPATRSQILAVHDAGYLHSLEEGTIDARAQRKIGFAWSRDLIRREKLIMGGTLQAAEFALVHGVAFNIAGGTHHAFANRGEGFCLLNDNAIAAQYLLDTGQAKRVLIVDLDVHQGNGTAAIFRHEPRVFTFSMHGAGNYPFQKECSDLDMPLPTGYGDEAYLALLRHQLPLLISRILPDFIFYLCGVDVLEDDSMGRLGMSLEGCKERDRLVLHMAHSHHIAIACSMGGGYSPSMRRIVEAHANTYRLALRLYF